MKNKKTVIFAVIFALLCSSFLYGCRDDKNPSVMDSTSGANLSLNEPEETTKLEKATQPEETTLPEETMESYEKLTEEILSGIWICESGFVCSYSDGIFINSTGMEYSDCTITNDGISGVCDYFAEETVHTGIQMIDDNTIEVNGIIAVKADSDSGQVYQANLSNQLEGDWVSCDYSDASFEGYNQIADGKFSVYVASGEDSGDTKNDVLYMSYEYTFENGVLVLGDGNSENITMQPYYVQMQDDVMSLFSFGMQSNLYRKGTQAEEDARSGKSQVSGDWVFVSVDNSEIINWYFDGDDTLTVEGYGNNEIRESKIYSVSRQNGVISLLIDGKEYYIWAIPSYGNCIGIYDGEECYGELYSSTSPDGLYYIDRANTIYSPGEIISRIFSENGTVPEISSVSLTLDCMSNLWLDDSITLCDTGSEYKTAFVCGTAYELTCSEPLKHAAIAFTYNPDELAYDYEKDLSVAYFDTQTDSFKLISTKLDMVNCTATAAISTPGIYALVDSYVLGGGKREVSELIPSCTSWARNCDTGDILSLIDLDYIQQCNGYFAVTNASELASAVYFVNTSFEAIAVISIENDIDLSNYEWAPMGWTDNMEEYPFSGWINGNSNEIAGLTIDSEDDNVGLIGWGLCSVSDLSLTDATVSGLVSVGILTGQAIGGKYSNCHADGTVNGSQAGSLIGYEAGIVLDNCSANVIVNGETFDFLSWNEKEKSEIVIEELVTITMDDDFTVTRPNVTGYMNLGWTVIYNGEVVLERCAENEYSYQYFRTVPGTYEIYLSAYVSGQYVPISNILKYTIE